jgi:glycosyltransferase involved in cell wall biosynthesis
MTRSDRFEKDNSPLRVVLLTLSGDVAGATAAVKERFPNATISNIPRMQVEQGSLLKRLKTFRAHSPDVFAIFMESMAWQRGQNVLKMFCSLSGAKRLVLMDARGGFKEEKRGAVLLRAPEQLAHEVTQSGLSIIKSQRRLARLENALKNEGRNIPRNNSTFPPEILFLRATPGAGTQPGGAATHINGFVRTVREQRASLRMIANDRIAGLDPDVPLKIIPLEPTGLTRSAFDLHNNLVFTDGVINEIEQSPPDLIYQRYSRFTFAGVEASLRLQRPLFLEYNGSEVWVGKHWDDAGMFPLLERFERLNLKAATRVFVVSEVERRNLLTAGIPDAKIIVNPNGVDVDRFKPGVGGADARASLHIKPNTVLVGFVGTFGPWHGVLELAKAIVKIPRDHGIHFLLVGAGQLLEAAKQVINEAGLDDRVTFTGSVDHQRVPGLLDACDILVSPHIPLADGSEFFGSPTKIFEYMAMGKGIVASRLGQIGEVLTHEESALLVEPGDTEQLSAAIVRLAESKTLRDQLGEAARRAAVENHTWKQNAQNVLNAYNSWLRETDQ